MFQLTACDGHGKKARTGEELEQRVKTMLACLEPVMSNPHIRKCGVGVLEDVKLLQKWGCTFPFECAPP